MDWLWEPLEYIGEVLVFIGVVGEVLTERKLILKNKEEKRDTLESVSSWMLVVGLAVSLAALIGTNAHFNGTIAGLNLQARNAEERAGEFEVETLLLKTQLIAQGPRVELLDDKRGNEIITALKPFAGQEVEVRYCQFRSRDNELMTVAMRIQYLLGKSGWSVFPSILPTNSNGTAIWISIGPTAQKSTIEAAEKLLHVLNDAQLQVIDPLLFSEESRSHEA